MGRSGESTGNDRYRPLYLYGWVSESSFEGQILQFTLFAVEEKYAPMLLLYCLKLKLVLGLD